MKSGRGEGWERVKLSVGSFPAMAERRRTASVMDRANGPTVS